MNFYIYINVSHPVCSYFIFCIFISHEKKTWRKKKSVPANVWFWTMYQEKKGSIESDHFLWFYFLVNWTSIVVCPGKKICWNFEMVEDKKNSHRFYCGERKTFSLYLKKMGLFSFPLKKRVFFSVLLPIKWSPQSFRWPAVFKLSWKFIRSTGRPIEASVTMDGQTKIVQILRYFFFTK